MSTLWRFLHRDHLGSVDAVTTATGTSTQRTSFDPFGGRRESTWASDITSASLTTLLGLEDELSPRGFTDHEMLNRTGFVHMNGRVYDPRIGRFVSPDPIVQAPFFSQSYNRYAYVFNSPLSFTDPTGFCTFTSSGGVDRLVCPGLGSPGFASGAPLYFPTPPYNTTEPDSFDLNAAIDAVINESTGKIEDAWSVPGEKE